VTAPNAAQLRAIRSADIHLLVAAGAGTGKTTTVVGRILYLLGVEIAGARHPSPVTLDRIGAITYTNAAAADLKAKLRARLREAGRRDDAYQVDNARIGTIHGFCGDLLRETALRSGRSPGFEVLEEGESGALRAEETRDALVAAVANGGVPGLEELFGVYRQEEVEEFVGRLAGDGDRLARMERTADLGAAERALVVLAQRARRLLEQRLDDQGAVDFDRMITWTRDLLRDDAAVRRRLQRRLHTLIVDEFQDVDPVQKEIAWLLGEPQSRAGDTPRLMLVGDPKQSIYRFRRADVTVWRSVEEAFAGGGLGEVVPLEVNYRSTAPILAFVDAAVGPVLDSPVNGTALQPFEVPYHPVQASPDAAGPADRAVELMLVPAGEKDALLKGEVRRAAEAAAMAQRARELHATGVRYGDMAALFAGLGSVEVYQGALERAGVPTYLLRGEGFYERREVLDLLLALRVVRNPDDDQAMIGFLRSPFVALRDETLLELAWQGEGSYWRRLPQARTDEPERVAQATALVERFRRLRDRVPVHELLEGMLAEGGYLAHLALLGEEGLQAAANVRKFLRIARQEEGASVGDFLRAVESLRDREEREGDERLHGQQDDVMTLTTIHSAKGLEWQVVFWCDLERKPPAVGGGGGKDKLLIGRDGIALKDPDAGKDDPQPPAWQALHDAEEEESVAERKRLWYVAATRARERLILTGVSAGGHEKHGPGQALVSQLTLPTDGGREFTYIGRDEREYIGALTVVPLVEESEPEVGDPWQEPLAPLREGVGEFRAPTGPARHSATSLLAWQRCQRRHWLRYVVGLREPEVERTGQDYMNAIARGQVVHEVLERLKGEAEFDDLLEAAIGRWDDSAPPPDTEAGSALRARLREEIALVADHPAYLAVANVPGARHELGFVRLLGPTHHLEGKMDLAAPGAAGLVLLDVKTTQRTDDKVEEIARHYAIQRAVYVEAAEAISGTPVERFAFQFSRAERQVSTPIGPEERTAGRELVADALDGIATGEAPLTTHAVECRYCGFKAAGWCPGAEGGA